jgi:phospholipid transport system substrate-binding protein
MTRVVIILALVCAMSSTAVADDPARSFVKDQYTKIKNILEADQSNEGVRNKVITVLESMTDFEIFGRMTMKRYWPEMSKKQKKTFLTWFRQLVHRSYVRRFKANNRFEHKFRGITQTKGDKAFVRTQVHSGNTRADVDYKLSKRGEKYLVYDIVIDEVSLMRNYRKQFRTVLKKNCGPKKLCHKGFTELIDRIQRKVATKGHSVESL